MALALSGPAAWATICAPTISGYAVGERVLYFVENRSQQPPVRMEQLVRGAEPKSFEVVRQPLLDRGPCAGRRFEYGRDHKQVYHRWQVIPGADPGTFSFLEGNYARDRMAIYSLAKRLTTRVGHFRTLAGGYATDGRWHFYDDTVIKEPHFELLGGQLHVGRGYARTDRRVYHKGQLLPDADARTFDLFKPEVGITRDKRAVYFDDRLIVGADPKTFEQVHGYTFKDRSAVYQQGRRLDGISPASVRASEFGTYLLDDQAVYRAGMRLPGRDAATFTELQHPWSRDKHAAYYQDNPVPGVDLDSFKTSGLGRAEDRHYRYEGLRRACKLSPDDPQQALPVCG